MSVGDDNDELRGLLDDDEWNEASEVGHSLKEMIDDYLQNAKPQAVAELTDLKEAIEKSYDDSRKARIAGTTATVTGSVIAITGFGLSFVTLGASLGLTVVGAVLAAAGGVTISGAEIGYLAVSRKKLKKTEKACQENNKKMQEIQERGEKYSDLIESLHKRHPTFTMENIFHLLRQAWNYTGPTFKTLYNGYKLIDGVIDVGRNAITVTTFARAGARAGSGAGAGVRVGARTVYSGLGTFGRVFSVGSVALDVLFIPIDITVLIKSAYDVHKYKNGYGKSNSAAAKNIGSILRKMEENETNLMDFRDKLPGAETDQVEDNGSN